VITDEPDKCSVRQRNACVFPRAALGTSPLKYQWFKGATCSPENENQLHDSMSNPLSCGPNTTSWSPIYMAGSTSSVATADCDCLNAAGNYQSDRTTPSDTWGKAFPSALSATGPP